MTRRAALLFEPLPIARLGVRRNDDVVVVGTDFSTFGFILEEFVSLGTNTIAIPASFPERSALSSSPPLLSQRIEIVDDTKEIESVNRLLHPLMSEMEISIDDHTGDLARPPNLSRRLFSTFLQIRRDLKCMALGLNKSLQIELYPNTARRSARRLRQISRKPNVRALLASLEGFFSYYEELEFNAVTPPKNTPQAMISLFDRLVNDPKYVEYCDSIATLPTPHLRSGALSRVRSVSRAIASSNIATSGWNYVTKLIMVGTGVPIPDSNILSTFVSNKTLPTIVDLLDARQHALQMWLSSCDLDVPYNRSGNPFPQGEVDWLAPVSSLSASHPGQAYLSLGTAGELGRQLQAFMNGRTSNT